MKNLSDLGYEGSSPAGAGASTGPRLAAAVRALAAEMDHLDDAAAARLGTHRTALRCLELLERRGAPMTAGQLAEELELTTGAVTQLVDRLVADGYAVRRRDEGDRRRVLVEVTPALRERTRAIFSGVGDAVRALTAGYSDEDLRLIIAFLDRLAEIFEDEALAVARLSHPT